MALRWLCARPVAVAAVLATTTTAAGLCSLSWLRSRLSIPHNDPPRKMTLSIWDYPEYCKFKYRVAKTIRQSEAKCMSVYEYDSPSNVVLVEIKKELEASGYTNVHTKWGDLGPSLRPPLWKLRFER